MQQYEVEEIVQRKTQRLNQCGVCGDHAQKICWSCHQTEMERLDEQISKLEERIEELERKEG